jgi:Xaa-Pro aminopeptidase/Xaa-Pro dipeptidase
MTRTVWLDGEPDAELRRIHAAVVESNEAGISAVRPGATGHDVDEACRAVLRRHGLEEHFLHSTGHGVGLEIHEAPSARRGSDDVLEPGVVLTVEPGAYIPGVGGVRIEDMVLVTDTGHEVLTSSPKELAVA